MALRITTRDDQPPTTVSGIRDLDDILNAASEKARSGSRLNGLVVEADNGNRLLVVVGSEETVLVFNDGGPNPQYYASKGSSSDADPIFTCYITGQHHTEFLRRNVISYADGLQAAREFLESNALPVCI